MNKQLIYSEIIEHINKYCDEKGYGPSIRELSSSLVISKSTIQRYLAELESEGLLCKSIKGGYQPVSMKNSFSTRAVAILGHIPCGPITEVESYIEDYVRLPSLLVGDGDYFLLYAKGDSMINAGIHNGDLVLIRQQRTADIGNIVVAFTDGGVTLKRLAYDNTKKEYYLHPENENFDDIYIDNLDIQGVAIKVIKDLD